MNCDTHKVGEVAAEAGISISLYMYANKMTANDFDLIDKEGLPFIVVFKSAKNRSKKKRCQKTKN